MYFDINLKLLSGKNTKKVKKKKIFGIHKIGCSMSWTRYLWQNIRISSLIWWIIFKDIKLNFNFKNRLIPLCEQKLKSSSTQGEEIIIYVFLATERLFRDQEECLLLFFFHQLFFCFPRWFDRKKKKDNVFKNCNHINNVALRLPLLGVFCAKSQIPNQKIKAQCSTYFPLENFREEKNDTSF